MFIDIDYTKRPKKAKFYLAKPNKTIISHIYEKFDDKLSLKLGNINELIFSIPYFVEENGKRVENEHIELIKEKMLIKTVYGDYKEWYIIDEIEENGDDSDIFNVKAFSLGYELKDKRISGYVEDAINLRDLSINLLENTLWTIGEIDPIFDNIYRSFESGENSNALECILKAAETFGALIVWDTENRKISFKDISKNGKFRGLTVNYGKLLRSIKRQRTTDEMVTRLYVYGSDDLSIQSVNPTGKPYIEDFSYFMYPFERDENRNVIRSSYYMSDELCHAILDHQELMQQYSPQIMNLTNQMLQKQQELVVEQSVLDQLNMQMENILSLLDIAKATEDEELIAQRTAERDALQAQIDAQAQITATLKIEIDNIQAQINDIYDTIAIESNFTPELLDELNYYIIEKEWRDDSYIDPQDLYNDALKKFEEIRQPKVIIEIDIDNLLNIVEEQYYWDKLVLGDLIKIKYPQMKLEYMAKIIEINYDLENGEISLVIANTKDLLNDTEKLVKLLYDNASASSIIQNNKHKLNKISEIESEVSRLIKSEWDATKNKIIAGVNNSIEIGKRGIIITNPDYPDEMIIIQSGVVALSKDRGETWQTAIKPDGIVAERLIGRIIAGEELIITNSAGTFTFDNSGVKIKAESFILESESGENLIDTINNSINDLKNRMTEAEFKLQDDQIISTVTSSEEFVTTIDSISQNISNINTRLTTAEEKITDSAIINTVTSSTAWSTLFTKDEIAQLRTEQLLHNTMWDAGTDYWTLGNGWTLDGSVRFEGSSSMKQNQTGQSTSNSYALESEKVFCTIGDKFVASIYAYTDNRSTIDIDARMEIAFYDTNDSRLLSNFVSIIPSANSNWERFSITGIAPANTSYVKMRVYVVRNGRIWVAHPMLQKGVFLTAWTPHIDELATELKSQITQTAGRVDIVVDANNRIKADAIASAISVTPSAINVISDSINLTGKVTFNSLDSSLQTKVNNGDLAKSTVDSWKVAGKTTINGGMIETNSISADKIKTNELVVGVNIAMSPNATISWNQVTNKPYIPQTASDIGALPANSPRLTYIDANGIYTGTISANQIYGGTITGITIISRDPYGATVELSGGSLRYKDIGLDNDYGSQVTIKNYSTNQRVLLKWDGLYIEDAYGNTKGTLVNNGSGVIVTGTWNFSGATVTGLTVSYASSAGNADTVDGYHASAFVQKYTDAYVTRVYASSGAFKYDDDNYLIVAPSGAKIYVKGSIKAQWSSIPKIRLDADGDGIINERSFGANNPASMQPLLMDFIPVKANGRTEVYLDENFVSFVGGYDVFVTGGKVVEKYEDYFVFEGDGDFTCLVIGIQRGKENVCGYVLDDIEVEEEDYDNQNNKTKGMKQKRIRKEKVFKEKIRKNKKMKGGK